MATPLPGNGGSNQAPVQPAAVRTYWAAGRSFGGRGLALLGASALASSAATAYVRYRARTADAGLPEEFVLEIDLALVKLVEKADASPLALLRGDAARQVELPALRKALEAAGKDGRVKGLLTSMASGGRESLGGLGFAGAQEVRSAIGAFRAAAGSRAHSVAFAPAFGEGGNNGSLPYYVACACGSVYVQPSGLVSLTGLESQGVFLRGLLDKIKVKPIFFTREEFKTAPNMFTETGYTAAHRSNVEELIGSLASQLLSGVAASRALPLKDVEAAMDAAPLLPGAALKAGLIDGMRYRTEHAA
ncbi:hypothetical protein FOA52_014881 [Chlamydomonas sp. UWO 241]|nr:hypothetical protein FOA52_014881 [Chlamydomonas sp. UWO 241]